MFDLVIRGGRSSMARAVPAGVLTSVSPARPIAAIGDLSRSDAGRVIEAAGLIVAPGFIDTHTHAEGALLVDPQNPMGVRQGITTLFLGIDGMSYAPLSPGNYRMFRRWLGGLLGDPPDDLDMSSVAAFRRHYHRKVAVNTAYLVPQGTVRLEVAGLPGCAAPRRGAGEGAPPRPRGSRAGGGGLLHRVEVLPRAVGGHPGADRAVPGRSRGGVACTCASRAARTSSGRTAGTA